MFVSLNGIIMPSTMFKIPSIACCKLPSPLLRIEKKLLCQEGIMLLWHGQVPFCYSLMFKKFLSLPNHSIRVCLTGKRINRGVRYGLQIAPEYLFYGNEKAIQWAKKTLDGVDGCFNKVI